MFGKSTSDSEPNHGEHVPPVTLQSPDRSGNSGVRTGPSATRTDRQLRLLPWIAIAWMAWLQLFPILSVDAHYHLATGRWIIEHNEVPVLGVGSATFGDRAWHDNEWGFQWLVATIAPVEVDADGVTVLTRFGVVMLILLRAAALAGTLLLLDRIFAGRGLSAGARTVALIWVGFLTFGNLFWTVRPQSLSYLFLAAALYLIDRSRRRGLQSAWPLIPLAILWSNIHGMFALLPVLLALEAAGVGLEALRERDGKALRASLSWAGLALVSTLAAAIHPYGFEQVLHPLRYMLEPDLVAGNVEWSKPDFLHLPLAVATFAATVSCWWLRPRPRAADVLRVFAFAWLAMSALRHLPVASIVIMEGFARRWPPIQKMIGRRTGVVGVMVVLLVVFWSGAFTRSTARFVRWVPDFAFRPLRGMPEAEVRWLRKQGVEGAVFNGYRSGGFLMFRLYPEERPVMDGRNDLHGDFRDAIYNPIRLAEPGWREQWQRLRNEFTINAVILDRGDALLEKLESEEGWLRVHPSPPSERERSWGQSDTVLLVAPDRGSRSASP